MLRCAASGVQKDSECGGVSNKLSVAHCSSYAQVDTYAIISHAHPSANVCSCVRKSVDLSVEAWVYTRSALRCCPPKMNSGNIISVNEFRK